MLGKLVSGISVVAAIFAALVTYALRVQAGDWPSWFSSWAVAQRGLFAFLILWLTLALAVVGPICAWLDKRHRYKELMGKVLADFSKALSKDRMKWNRLTLFKATNGWKQLLWSAVTLPLLDKSHKWRAWRRIKARGKYLGVYLRPSEVRNVRSAKRNAQLVKYILDSMPNDIRGRVLSELKNLSAGDSR